MRVVLKNLQVPDGSVALDARFDITLTVAEEVPGVVGADAVKLECLAAGYTFDPGEVPCKKAGANKVSVALRGPRVETETVVGVRAVAGNVFAGTISIRKEA